MQYFECRAKYKRLTDDSGILKTVSESYLVDSLSCAEAEARVIKEITPFVNGDVEVVAAKKSNVCEVVNTDGSCKWHKAKAEIVTLDEVTAVEKRHPYFMLVEGADFASAYAGVSTAVASSPGTELVSLSAVAIVAVLTAGGDE